MHNTTLRRGVTCAAAALAFAAMAAPAAQADVATDYAAPDVIEVDDPTDLLASVEDWSPAGLVGIAAASIENTESLSNPVGSLEIAWDGIRCFGTTPGVDGEDNCWF